ncbi:hypothetical protein [Lysobacter sp. Hz 25]|uniref:hypothetical protein n=1 Tax=Lysobacter sp. Hz 25 TaxID=3383698 RepID=UPI0038D39B5D
MTRDSIILKRSPGSLLDTLPLDDMALAYLQSIEGIADVRINRSTATEIELTFAWYGEGSAVLPEDRLNGYGLIRDR